METKQIDIIKAKCAAEGLNIYEVFRRAGVPQSTISNWTRKDPEQFAVKSKIEKTIKEMVNESIGESRDCNEGMIITPVPVQRRRS